MDSTQIRLEIARHVRWNIGREFQKLARLLGQYGLSGDSVAVVKTEEDYAERITVSEDFVRSMNALLLEEAVRVTGKTEAQILASVRYTGEKDAKLADALKAAEKAENPDVEALAEPVIAE